MSYRSLYRKCFTVQCNDAKRNYCLPNDFTSVFYVVYTSCDTVNDAKRNYCLPNDFTSVFYVVYTSCDVKDYVIKSETIFVI